MFNILEAKN